MPLSGDLHVPVRLRDGLEYALTQRARLRISCAAFQPLRLALDLPLLFEGLTSLKHFNLIYEMTKWEDLHIDNVRAHCLQFRRDRAWSWRRISDGTATGEEIIALCMGVMSMHFHTQAELLPALAWVWVREFKRVSSEVTIEYSWVRLVVMDDQLSTPAASYFNRAFELLGFRAEALLTKDGIKLLEGDSPPPDLAWLSRRETLEDCKMRKDKLLREWLMLLKEVTGLVTDSDVGLLEFENIRL